MSVTVVQTPDVTSDIFNAWRTIEDIKNKGKQIAMDQALASQHLQSAKTIDQMNQAKLQMDQQQANEFTSPQGIQNRQQMQDTALQQRQGDVAQQSLQNKRLSNENPLHLIQQEQLARQARISADSAQQGLNHLQEMWPDEKDFSKMIMQAKKYELISKNGLDPHSADLLSKIKGTQDAMTLQQLPQVANLQQKQLDQALSDIGSKGIVDRLKTFSGAAASLGVSGAKAAVAGMTGYENFANVPDDSMGNHGSEKDREIHMLVSLAKSGDKDAIEVLGSRIANSAGAAKPNSMSGMLDDKGKPIFNSAPDPLVEASKRVAAKFATQAKLNPQTGEYYIGDPNEQLQEKRGTILFGKPTTGVAAPTELPSSKSITPPPVVSETQKLEGGVNPLDKFNEMEDVITNRYKGVADKTYVPNRATDVQYGKRSGTGESNDVDQLVSFPLDPQFSILKDGRIFDSTKANTTLAQSQKTLGGLPTETQAVDANLSISDKKFQDAASSAIKGGMNDPQASAGQTARFSAVMSQLARGYKENGDLGMKAVISLANQKYKRGDMTDAQAAHIKALLGVYGIK